ncbi:MAG: PfkB family carbohydrate kinase [bacterium]|nr:PfkB family carbohydrate kinase [bacterium]
MDAPVVIVIGSATIDVIDFGGRIRKKIGGVATYAGVTFRRHGLGTAVAANVATEDIPLFRLFPDEDLLWTNGPTRATTRFINRETGAGRAQEMPSAADPIRCCAWLAERTTIRHVHLGPLHPDDIHPDTLSLAGSGRYFVSLDVQGYARRAEGKRIVPSVSDRLETALAAADAVKADETEWELILAHFGSDTAGLRSRLGFGELLLTAGARGGRLIDRKGRVIDYAPDPVPPGRVEDPTGAGDVFFAAYLAGRHHEGWTERESLTHAARIAAQQVSGKYLTPASLSAETDSTEGDAS